MAETGSKVALLVAIIGASGVIVAAYISSHQGEKPHTSVQPVQQSVQPSAVPPTVMPAPNTPATVNNNTAPDKPATVPKPHQETSPHPDSHSEPVPQSHDINPYAPWVKQGIATDEFLDTRWQINTPNRPRPHGIFIEFSPDFTCKGSDPWSLWVQSYLKCRYSLDGPSLTIRLDDKLAYALVKHRGTFRGKEMVKLSDKPGYSQVDAEMNPAK